MGSFADPHRRPLTRLPDASDWPRPVLDTPHQRFTVHLAVFLCSLHALMRDGDLRQA